jgi:hypothetical protein
MPMTYASGAAAVALWLGSKLSAEWAQPAWAGAVALGFCPLFTLHPTYVV